MTIHGAKKGGGKPRQPIIAPDLSLWTKQALALWRLSCQ